MSEAVLTVPNISCEHCERSVKEALTPAEGVEQVTVDIPSKTVKVVYDAERVGVEQLSAILAAEDYPVASVSG
jgi:copper chaperone